jgi:hypothetical protein
VAGKIGQSVYVAQHDWSFDVSPVNEGFIMHFKVGFFKNYYSLLTKPLIHPKKPNGSHTFSSFGHDWLMNGLAHHPINIIGHPLIYLLEMP